MKLREEYDELYKDVPRNETDRLYYIKNTLNITDKKSAVVFEEMNRILSIPWKKFGFVIYLIPKATPRPRHNRKSGIFYVKGAKDNKKYFEKFFKKHIDEFPFITTPCKFTCISYLPIPKSMPKIEQVLAEMKVIRPAVKPDWDNLGKTYSDMIQGTLLLDDNLIIEGISKKYYSFKPRIEIQIEYMEEFDSKFNEKKIRKKVEK